MDLTAYRRILAGFAGLAAFSVAACTQPTPRVAPSTSPPAEADVASRNLLHGPGGQANAPSADVGYKFVKVDQTGYSDGFDVTAPDGTPWSIKLGREAQPEVVSSRLLWGIGYHQPATYYLPRWALTGQRAGPQGEGRFRREPTTVIPTISASGT